MVITRICRLCQKSGCLDVTDATFELAGESFQLRDAYRSFTSLSGTPVTEPLQTLQICFGCTNELVAAFAFLAKVSAAEERQLAARKLPLPATAAVVPLPLRQAKVERPDSPTPVADVAAANVQPEPVADTADANNGDHPQPSTGVSSHHLVHDDRIIDDEDVDDPANNFPDELDIEFEDDDGCLTDELNVDDGEDGTDANAVDRSTETIDDHRAASNVQHDHSDPVHGLDDYTSEAEYIDDYDVAVAPQSPPAPAPPAKPIAPAIPQYVAKRPAPPAPLPRQLANKRPCVRPANLPAGTPDHITVDLRTVLVPQYMISDLDLSTRPDFQAVGTPSPNTQFRTMDVFARRLSHIGLQRVAQLIDQPVSAVVPADAGDGTPAPSIVYMCTYCTKAFATTHHLMVHTRKNHVCQFCMRTFGRPSELHLHMREAHRTVRYLCALCERDFRGNSNLRFHMKHTHMVSLPASWSLLSERFVDAETRERIMMEQGEEGEVTADDGGIEQEGEEEEENGEVVMKEATVERECDDLDPDSLDRFDFSMGMIEEDDDDESM